MSKSSLLWAVVVLICLTPLAKDGVAAKATRGAYCEHKIVSGGTDRIYGIYIPKSYDPAIPTALVLNLHETSGNPREQFIYSNIQPVADKHGFIAVMPAVIRGASTWNALLDPKGIDDVRFIRDLIKELAAKYNIDPKRIYAMGLSGGARMASRLGCEMAGTLAAIAAVAGIQFLDDCQPSRPLPVIVFHGKLDKLNPYTVVGSAPKRWNVGVEDSVARWVKNSRCSGPARIEKKSSVVSKRSWSTCQGGSEVVFYVIENGGHTWPGSPVVVMAPWAGETNQDIKATELMWQFFASHPLP